MHTITLASSSSVKGIERSLPAKGVSWPKRVGRVAVYPLVDLLIPCCSKLRVKSSPLNNMDLQQPESAAAGGAMEIPGYNIVDTLGEGRTATVYLAFVEHSDQAVALKVFSRSVSDDKAFGVQFARQASLLSVLEHPNIAAVYEQGSHAGRYYLAMEYIRGRTLRHLRFDLELPEQLGILHIVAQALGAAHQLGCVHGNLTLDNIMLHSDTGQPVVLDFGVGWPTGSAAGVSDLSPEQGRGSIVDERTDLYGLGRMLLLLLCDLLPHPPTLPGEVPQLRPELELFQPLLDGALAPEPEQRYKNCAEFAEALGALSAEQINAVIKSCEEVLMREGEVSQSAAKAEQDTCAPVKSQADVQTQVELPRVELDLAEPDKEVPVEGLTAHTDDRIEPRAARKLGWGAVLPWALALLVVLGALFIMLQPA